MARSPRQTYLDWRRTPAVGCVFARYLSRSPEDHGQAVESIEIDTSPDQIAQEIAHRTSDLIADAAIKAALILLPKVRSVKELAEISIELGQLSGWTVSTSELDAPPDAEMTAVHLFRDVPFADTTTKSEILVFGPFDEMPATRRAPVTAIEFLVCEPMGVDPKTQKPTTRANLAHLELELPSQAAFDSMWNGSFSGRLKSLGGEDSRAKAKVSFAISSALASELGLAP